MRAEAYSTPGGEVLLGQLELRRRSSVLEARRKVRDALSALGAEELAATELTAGVAEVARAILAVSNNRGCIRIWARTRGGSLRLRLRFESDVAVTIPPIALRFLDPTSVGRGAHGCHGHEATLSLRADPDCLSSARVDAARQHLALLSRAELLLDVQEKNVALEIQQRELSRMVEEARRATEAKSSFLANMSHELRTPLNSIIGFTKRLSRRLPGQVGERDLDALDTVSRNARHLLSLIDDILDLSKIEAGKLELVPASFSLDELLADVVTQCEPLLSSDRQQLVLSIDDGAAACEALADRRKIFQIVTNLVSNAIKYSDDGTVTVALEVAREVGLGAVGRIAVSDEGEGMTEEQRAKLFSAFTRLDTDATRRVGGTGLGLAISAHFAAMHGGRIEVESTLGEGSVFRLVLPLDCTTTGARSRASATHESSAPSRTVLCVDDDPHVAAWARVAFENTGVEVLFAESLAGLRELIRGHHPELVCVSPAALARHTPEELAAVAEFELGEVELHLLPEVGGRAPLADSGVAALLSKSIDPDVLAERVVAAAGGRARRALVVEDMPDLNRLFCSILAERGIQVDSASDGAEALRALEQGKRPDVLLLDLMLPNLNGFEVLERMPRDPPPVIVVTSMDIDERQCRRLQDLRAVVLHRRGGRRIARISDLGDRAEGNP